MKACPKMRRIIKQIAAKHEVDLTEVGAYLRLDMPGYDRLCIETLATTRLSVAHFFEVQGQRIPEPDVLFFVDAKGRWIPIGLAQSLQQWRTYVELSDEGRVLTANYVAQRELADFCETWAQNLIEQEWLEHGVKHEESRRRLYLDSPPWFPLGHVVATPGALEALEKVGQTPAAYIVRHVTGDFGELDEHDLLQNMRALSWGGRIFSAYTLTDGMRIWVISEADRSVTTVLTPSEY